MMATRPTFMTISHSRQHGFVGYDRRDVEYAHFILKVPVSGEFGGLVVGVRNSQDRSCSGFRLGKEGSGQMGFVCDVMIGCLTDRSLLGQIQHITPYRLAPDHGSIT